MTSIQKDRFKFMMDFKIENKHIIDINEFDSKEENGVFYDFNNIRYINKDIFKISLKDNGIDDKDIPKFTNHMDTKSSSKSKLFYTLDILGRTPLAYWNDGIQVFNSDGVKCTQLNDKHISYIKDNQLVFDLDTVFYTNDKNEVFHGYNIENILLEVGINTNNEFKDILFLDNINNICNIILLKDMTRKELNTKLQTIRNITENKLVINREFL